MKYLVEVGGQTIEVELDGDRVRVDGVETVAQLSDLPGTPMALLSIGERIRPVAVTRAGSRGRYTLTLDGRRYDVEALDERTRAIRQLSAATAAPSGPAPLIAPMPGLIVRVNVEPGMEVQPGQGLVVMEAMKMENEMRASHDCKVKEILVKAGDSVESGQTLVTFETK